MHKIELLFLNRAMVRPGGMMAFTKSDAIEFVDACKKEEIQILGIDGFFPGEQFIQPSMASSIDLTSAGTTHKNKYDEAICFLLDQDEAMYFAIVTPGIA
jgi:hypothetical protein